ncbi:MAG: hypothetical protein ACRDVP_00745 [Acidimicrobiales bacterium]
MRRITPYILLGLLVLGSGFGIGLGVAGSGATNASRSELAALAASPCSLVPTSSIASLTHDSFDPSRIRPDLCIYAGARIGFSYPELIVRISQNQKTVMDISRLLEPKAKVSEVEGYPSPVRRHFIEVDGTSTVWIPTFLDGVAMSAMTRATLLQITVVGLSNKYIVAHKMMGIALNRMIQPREPDRRIRLELIH